MANFLVFLVSFMLLSILIAAVNVNANRTPKTYAFTVFLVLLIIWITIEFMTNQYVLDDSVYYLLMNILMISMLSLAPVYLFFVYTLCNRKIDKLIIIAFVINYGGIIARYFYPMNLDQGNFWRIEEQVPAMIFATTFTIPMVFAIYVLINQMVVEKDLIIRMNLKFNIIGVIVASVISIFSEYLLPIVFNVNIGISLMSFSIIVFSYFTYYALFKYRFLDLGLGRLYESLFDSSLTGIMILNKEGYVIRYNDSINTI